VRHKLKNADFRSQIEISRSFHHTGAPPGK
jgi:hypothetical protein